MSNPAVVAQSPAAQVFGLEVADEQNKNKNLLQQSVAALVANGVAVALPGNFLAPGADDAEHGLTPEDVMKNLINNLLSAINGIKASFILMDGSNVHLLKIVALSAGVGGNSITVAVAAGSSSGKKITIVKGGTNEVYDNLADINAAVAAIHGVSALVDAVKIADGTLANISASNLIGALSVTPPTFSGVALDDGASQRIDKWGNAIFSALQSAGYIA